VYHVTLFDGDDSSASSAVVGVDGMEARGAVGSSGQHDVLVTGEWTVALGTEVVINVVAVAACLGALLGEYQLYTHAHTIVVCTTIYTVSEKKVTPLCTFL